ncbi:MAG: acetolactate synthase small subunit [Lachnospiraceae bacterium]|nr:acetolactate synthase small subunit [Lachnospiraceae bacterium]
MRKAIFSLLVENTPGVTSHISGLFSRRGYNIDSFASGETADPRFERITIVCSGEDDELTQIENQLAKLEDVRNIKKLDPESSVTSELMLVKIRATDKERGTLTSLTDVYHGKVVDVTRESMIIELKGQPGKLEAFLDLLSGYEILELARTGLIGLTRGSADVVYLD